MVRPAVVVVASAGPHVALRQMRESQASAAYVVDRDRTLLGVVRDEDIVAAVRVGAAALVDLTRGEVTAVSQDALLAELFAPAAETPLPVPVVDPHGKLVGVIPRVTLLEAMAPSAAEPTATENLDDELDELDEELDLLRSFLLSLDGRWAFSNWSSAPARACEASSNRLAPSNKRSRNTRLR